MEDNKRAADDAEREAFEAWVSASGREHMLERDHPHLWYKDLTVSAWWTAWQARAALSRADGGKDSEIVGWQEAGREMAAEVNRLRALLADGGKGETVESDIRMVNMGDLVEFHHPQYGGGFFATEDCFTAPQVIGKGEAVYQVKHAPGMWMDCDEDAYARTGAQWRRIVYTAPQAECAPREAVAYVFPVVGSGATDLQGNPGVTIDAPQAECAPREAQPVAWLVDWPDEPELGHYFSEEFDPNARSRPLYLAAPTPERADGDTAGAQPWIERWHGSHPQRGWSIVQGRDVVAYLGGDESMSDSVSAIVKAHNDCFDCGGTGCTMNCSGLHNVDCAGQSFSTEGQSGDLAAAGASQERADAGKDAALTDEQLDAIWYALPVIRIHNEADRAGMNAQVALRRAFARAILAANKEPK
jgi:hypothetical protein